MANQDSRHEQSTAIDEFYTYLACGKFPDITDSETSSFMEVAGIADSCDDTVSESLRPLQEVDDGDSGSYASGSNSYYENQNCLLNIFAEKNPRS